MDSYKKVIKRRRFSQIHDFETENLASYFFEKTGKPAKLSRSENHCFTVFHLLDNCRREVEIAGTPSSLLLLFIFVVVVDSDASSLALPS